MNLNNLLTKEQEGSGLTLNDDEDFIYLCYGKNVLATWSAGGASQVMIRVKAQEMLDHLPNLGLVAEVEKLQAHHR